MIERSEDDIILGEAKAQYFAGNEDGARKMLADVYGEGSTIINHVISNWEETSENQRAAENEVHENKAIQDARNLFQAGDIAGGTQLLKDFYGNNEFQFRITLDRLEEEFDIDSDE